MGAILDTLVERDEQGNMLRGYRKPQFAGHVTLPGSHVLDDMERVNWTIKNGSGVFWRFFNDTIETMDYFFTDADTAFHFKMRWR